MAYTPINTPAYLHAYAGAVSGMANTGRLTDPVRADYVAITRVASAFAKAFDQAWDDPTPLSPLVDISISVIVSQQFQGRGVPDIVANPQLTRMENWAIDAAAAAGLLEAGEDHLAREGIVATRNTTPSNTVTFNPKVAANWNANVNNVKQALDALAQQNAGNQANAAQLGPGASVQLVTNTVTPIKTGTFLVLASISGSLDGAESVSASLVVDLGGQNPVTLDTRGPLTLAAAGTFELSLLGIAQLHDGAAHTFGYKVTASAGNVTIPQNDSNLIIVEL